MLWDICDHDHTGMGVGAHPTLKGDFSCVTKTLCCIVQGSPKAAMPVPRAILTAQKNIFRLGFSYFF